MPSADRVPVKTTHSTMRWPKWVVLNAGSTGPALRAGSTRPLLTKCMVQPCVARDFHQFVGLRRLLLGLETLGKTLRLRLHSTGAASLRAFELLVSRDCLA